MKPRRPWSKIQKKCECPAVYALGVCRPCYMRRNYQETKAARAAHYLSNKERIVAARRARKPAALLIHRKYMNLPAPTREAPTHCELCGRLPIKGGRPVALCLDHDHDTGRFRGWLCDRCNRTLGLLGDTLAAARKAVAYLERVQ